MAKLNQFIFYFILLKIVVTNSIQLHFPKETTSPVETKETEVDNEAKVNKTVPNGGSSHRVTIEKFTENDLPACNTQFREEHTFEYFVPPKAGDAYVIQYNRPTAALAGTHPKADPYLVNIFNGTNMPPYMRIECHSWFPMEVSFEGLDSNLVPQFFRVWTTRQYLETGRVVHFIGAEFLLPPGSDGLYKVGGRNNAQVVETVKIQTDLPNFHLRFHQRLQKSYHLIPPNDPRVEALQLTGRNFETGVFGLCEGPPNSNVTLLHFETNPAEAGLITECLRHRFSPCGSSFHHKTTGHQLTSRNKARIGVRIGVRQAGLLVCRIDDELIINQYFFTLDGKGYFDWRAVRNPEDLRRITVELQRTPKNAVVLCKAADSVFIADKRTIFAKLVNGQTLKIEERSPWESDYNKIPIDVTPEVEQVICSDETYSFASEFNTTFSIPANFTDCLEHEFKCQNGQCIHQSTVCDRNSNCDDGSDERGCHYKDPCPESHFECKNGKCIPLTYRCDGDNDCKDEEGGSDESKEVCTSPSFQPHFLTTRYDYTFVLGEQYYINCSVKDNRATTRLEWKAISGATQTALPIYGCSLDWGRCDAVLLFPNVAYADAGSYVCISNGRNVHTQARRIFNVSVKEGSSSGSECFAPADVAAPGVHPFVCTASGKYPDPQDCKVFHECVPSGRESYTDYRFNCGANTVYCKNTGTCDWEWNCPCKYKNHI